MGAVGTELSMRLVLVPLACLLAAAQAEAFQEEVVEEVVQAPFSDYVVPRGTIQEYLQPTMVQQQGGGFRLEYLNVQYNPAPRPAAATTKKPELGFFKKIFRKKTSKFGAVRNLVSGFLRF